MDDSQDIFDISLLLLFFSKIKNLLKNIFKIKMIEIMTYTAYFCLMTLVDILCAIQFAFIIILSALMNIVYFIRSVFRSVLVLLILLTCMCMVWMLWSNVCNNSSTSFIIVNCPSRVDTIMSSLFKNSISSTIRYVMCNSNNVVYHACHPSLVRCPFNLDLFGCSVLFLPKKESTI